MFSRKIGGHVCGMSTFYEYVSEYVLSHSTEHFLWKCLWGNVCGMSWLPLSLSPSLSHARALSLSLSSSLSVRLALPLSFPLFISLALSLSLTHTPLLTLSLSFSRPPSPVRACVRARRPHSDNTQTRNRQTRAPKKCACSAVHTNHGRLSLRPLGCLADTRLEAMCHSLWITHGYAPPYKYIHAFICVPLRTNHGRLSRRPLGCLVDTRLEVTCHSLWITHRYTPPYKYIHAFICVPLHTNHERLLMWYSLRITHGCAPRYKYIHGCIHTNHGCVCVCVCVCVCECAFVPSLVSCRHPPRGDVSQSLHT